jgi:SAM-dependent methyltransferase
MREDPFEQNIRAQVEGMKDYLRRDLEPAERRLLELLRGHWSDLSMLDVGVGAGRTPYTFAAVAGRYVGIDVAPEMIEMSRRLIGEDGSVQFVVCDARRASETFDEQFDVVLFSFNGIDSVGLEDRRRILAGVRQLLAPDGLFLFSAHSLLALPFRAPPVSHGFGSLSRNWRVRQTNRRLDLDGAMRRGWEMVRDGNHDWKTVYFYALPEWQAGELSELGFELVDVYGRDGRSVDLRRPGRDPWLHYLCRPAA